MIIRSVICKMSTSTVADVTTFMLLFASIVDIDTGRPIACADHSGTAGGNAKKSFLGSECLVAARELCTELLQLKGARSARCLAARACGGELRLYSLSYGNFLFVVAAPASTSASSFAAVAMLSDVSARWDTAAVNVGTPFESAPMDDVALLARLVHFSSVQVLGDAAFSDADIVATANAHPAHSAPRGWASAHPNGAMIVGGSVTDQSVSCTRGQDLIAARQADGIALASKVADLEATKRDMEAHSNHLLA